MSLTFTPENFPNEVLALVFSQSSPKAVLLTGQLINKHWHRVANQPIVWQSLIRQHCPYLIQERNEEYLNNSKALYKAEFDSSSDRKEFEFSRAALNGRIDIVKALLTQAGQQISPETQGKLLQSATQRGDLAVIQALLVHSGHLILARDKAAALIQAAKSNQPRAVELLLNLAGQEISSEDKHSALFWVRPNHWPWPSSYNVLQMVRALLAQMSTEHKNIALVKAIEFGFSPEVVKEFSIWVDDRKYIIKALQLTINRHPDFVDGILAQRGHELSHAQQIEALGPNGARDYRASKRSIARSLALEGAGESNNPDADEAQPDRKRPRR